MDRPSPLHKASRHNRNLVTGGTIGRTPAEVMRTENVNIRATERRICLPARVYLFAPGGSGAGDKLASLALTAPWVLTAKGTT